MSEAFVESHVLEGEILVIKPRGDLDATSTPEFERLVNEHLAGGHTKIIVDCQRMGYVSSLGIGSLVALQARLRRQGGVVKLAAIQGPVMQLLKAVRLDRVLDMYGDTEFARLSFAHETGDTPPAN